MARRKRSIFYYLGQIFVNIFKLIGYIIKGLIKGVHYFFKGIVFAIEWIVNKIKSRTKKETTLESKEERTENKTNENVIEKKPEMSIGKIKADPAYEQFKEVKNIKGSFENFEEKRLTSSSTIGIILGARGTGKSAIGMKLLENFKAKTGKNIYALGFNSKDLPNWINVVKSIDDVENNSVLLVDESGIEFSSRESMTNKNKLLSNILLISRHRDLSLALISQSSANIEINAIRQSDYIILKPSSLLQKDFERKRIKEMYDEVDKEFEELKDDEGLAYIYSHNYKGFISNPLPSFWNSKVSKAYGNYK